MTMIPQIVRGTWARRNTCTRIPAISAICNPLMAKICIVPDLMNGSQTSSVSAVFHPRVIAQSNRKSSSTTGKRWAIVACAHS
jgi:hypothetical protein